MSAVHLRRGGIFGQKGTSTVIRLTEFRRGGVKNRTNRYKSGHPLSSVAAECLFGCQRTFPSARGGSSRIAGIASKWVTEPEGGDLTVAEDFFEFGATCLLAMVWRDGDCGATV